MVEPDGAEEYYNMVDALEQLSTADLIKLIKEIVSFYHDEVNSRIKAVAALEVLRQRLEPTPITFVTEGEEAPFDRDEGYDVIGDDR